MLASLTIGQDMSNMIRVNEIFTSIQGEGFWTGTPCCFIRLQGCTTRCSFCDSKDTWDLNGGILIIFQEILEQIPEGIRHVVLTGGEPTLHSNLLDLIKVLYSDGGYFIHIETSGNHYEALRKIANSPWIGWVTLSPKQNIPTLDVLLLADELKWVIQTKQDLWTMDEIWVEIEESRRADGPIFYLQPMSCEKEATDLCIKHVLANADRDYRLSIQVHKYIGVR